MQTIIEVKNLTHIFNAGLPFETVALNDISFTVNKGDFIGLIGHTGSGKSTLIQHLNGLLRPNSGTIVVNGVTITDKDVKLRDLRRKVGLVFQYPEYQLFEETVVQDVEYGPMNLGLSKEETALRAKEAIGLVGLDYEEIKERSPFALSGGQKRRVAIAGVIAMKPEVLILDEPTAGLDPKAHKDVLNMIESIKEERDMTIIFVSHNMGDVARLSNRVFVMDGGRLCMSGTPKQVFSKAEELFQIGLALPPATAFMFELKKAGIPVSTEAMTGEEAFAEILAWKNQLK